jgi:hypothetical protein
MKFFDRFRQKRGADSDLLVLQQLRKAGSDLSKPHRIEFFLYFPTQQIAEQASLQLRATGFNVDVQPGATSKDWLCFATKEMQPDLASLQKIRADFQVLAASLGGEYDGWGTPIVC